MSEKSLKIIFALVVFSFVAFGKNISSTTISNNKTQPRVVAEYRTASLIANNALDPKEEISLRAESLKDSSNAATTTSSSSQALPHSATNNIPRIAASMYLLGDIDENENILQLSPDKRWPIASLTKLMTALIAAENIPANTLVTVSESSSKTDGLAGVILPGKIFSKEDLIKTMVVTSNNHAASAIQDFVGKDKFVALMNATAKRLGMYDTYYVEATGLSVLNQSTAADLKTLTYYIWKKHNEIFTYTRSPEVKIFEKSKGSATILRNINSFAGQDDFLGGKTGFITESGGNLISIFSRSNRPIITIVLGADDRFLETKKLMQWFDHL